MCATVHLGYYFLHCAAFAFSVRLASAPCTYPASQMMPNRNTTCLGNIISLTNVPVQEMQYAFVVTGTAGTVQFCTREMTHICGFVVSEIHLVSSRT